jgi:hypothetical protein
MKTKHVRTDEPILATPSTAAEWRERISELETQAARAEQVLTEKRAARREAAGSALVFGTNPEAAAALEAEEREAERLADSLRCAVDLARAEMKRLQDEERRQKIEQQRARRAAVATRIQQEAEAIDRLYQQTAGHLDAIADLLINYQMEGGAFARSLKGCSTRAALAAGLRKYLETGFVGGNEHIRPLAEQLSGLAVARVPEDWLLETPPAA